MGIAISPSILSSDFANLSAELSRIESADWAHIDVMDNHFVPNLTIGQPVVEALAKVSPVPIDAHLMIEDPDRWAPGYVEAGAASVTFHVEAATAPFRLSRQLRTMGAKVGMALRPATPVEPMIDLLPAMDMLLIMTVEPGFGGQSFLAATLPKIRRARRAIDASGLQIALQVDGGVGQSSIEQCAEAGADVFVAGSAVYGADDIAGRIAGLRQAAQAAHDRRTPGGGTPE
ncbi:MAG: ribulose-phosphate 3-epimerase [Micrococcales bacterium]|nr:MAG: ribulose-phosphate 3-epimerase [Micrococcales bacterium]